jgi:hypothetical protein
MNESPSPGPATATHPPSLAGSTISVFGSSTLAPGEAQWELAEALGRHLALAGAHVMNGGYGGAMEAVSRGARAAGGHVIGVTVAVFDKRTPNRFLSERRHAETLIDRLRILLSADGFVALEGSVGTLAELFLVWNHVMIGSEPRPLVCLGAGWQEKLDALREKRFLTDPELFRLVSVAEDPADAVRLLGKRKGAGS